MSDLRWIWLTVLVLLMAACGGPAPTAVDVKLTGAVSKDDTTVELTFSEAVGEEAKNVANYKISPDLAISAATLSANDLVVSLTTEPQSKTDYSVAVQNIKSKKGGKLDPASNKTGFKGGEGPAQVKEILSTGPTGVQVGFTKAMSDSAGDANNYRIVKADGSVLAVTAASLNSFKTQVNLTTADQEDTNYTLSISNITDASGRPLDLKGKGGFKGTLVDKLAPRVTGAGALDPNTVVVTFSEEVKGGVESAEFAGNYTIVSTDVVSSSGAAVNANNVRRQAVVIVIKAVLNPDKKSVTLTTLDQYDFEYQLKVIGVKDLAGNILAPPDRDNPFQTKFKGKAASGPYKDSDGDGVEDMWEMVGWTVKIVDGNGNVANSVVTSDPGDPTKAKDDPFNVAARDTDADGLDDLGEISNRLDPRTSDTDGDRLTDPDELKVWYSKADDQDTDNDGLLDGNEVEINKTSPIDPDTDGDKLPDGVEVTRTKTSARLADLPRVDIEIGSVGFQLDYRFDETINNQTTLGQTKSTTQTTLQAQQTGTSQENSSSNEWFARAGGEVCWMGGCSGTGALTDLTKLWGGKASAEAGGGGSNSFTSTSTSEQLMQQEYAKTLTEDSQVQEGKTVTRTVVGSKMLVNVTLKNKSNLAFTVSNIEITGQRRDPEDPTKLIPLATFKPSSADGISLGPISKEKGPLIFNAIDSIPSVVDSLMRSPDELVFSIANYKVEVEDAAGLKRDLVYTEQDVIARTAFIEIDYNNNAPLEKYRPAPYFGYDEQKNPKGMTLKQVMEEILGLKHMVATPSGNGCTESTPPGEQAGSYSTCLITVNGKQVEALWRVRKVSRVTGQPQNWFVLTPKGLITPTPYTNPVWEGSDFNSLIVLPGQELIFKFDEDKDNDFLRASEEFILGSSDTNKDSDGDGIEDAVEVFGPLVNGDRQPYLVNFDDGRPNRVVFSSPARADTDGDGLSDCQELSPTANNQPATCAPIYYVLSGDGTATLAAPASGRSNIVLSLLNKKTDPSDRDTDGDGLNDLSEMMGLKYSGWVQVGNNLQKQNVVLAPRKPAANILPAINPWHRDPDGDLLVDAKELAIGTNPLVNDGNKVFDTDGDTLVNFIETLGWKVQFERVSTQAGVPGSLTVAETWGSDPTKKDSDSDGIDDAKERAALTNPRSTDTDGDGLSDGLENGPGKTNALDVDSDNDLRSDGAEINTPILIQVFGEAARNVFTDPLKADADNDGFVDGEEQFGSPAKFTDPNEFDTDKDGTADGIELNRQKDAITTNNTDPLRPDQLLNISYDIRGVKWTNGKICGQPGAAYFTGDLKYSVNGVETSSYFTLGQNVNSTWIENIISKRLIILSGNINARSENLKHWDGGVVPYIMSDFNESFTPDNPKTFFAAAKSKIFKVQQKLTNDDACAAEFNFKIVPITGVN